MSGTNPYGLPDGLTSVGEGQRQSRAAFEVACETHEACRRAGFRWTAASLDELRDRVIPAFDRHREQIAAFSRTGLVEAPNHDQRTGIRTEPRRMWLDELPHTATAGRQGWQVSWLPNRNDLSQQQAHDALVVAKLANSYRVAEMARRDWPEIQKLARSIGVPPREAVTLIRDAEARARDRAVPTTAAQVPHLGVHEAAHPELWDREIRVDAPTPPRVHTPGRVPDEWLISGELLDLDRGPNQ
ncbi:hypothetical protein VMT65_31165 [Nocardia sp. CDC153]|uniref:hypothetical protein n=1 Tax=Nocardia sp. CDC153 TaxID=3112167 RepID=UPI002DBC1C9B|nr:hypothetical protein [Nocardia sp. CDC153]MEC3957530.1 hypothetical protein [Nocardia sp. CDC153]